MSKHVATGSAAQVSPKVKAGGYTGAALTILATAFAAGIAAIPDEAWDGLGVWGVPVGVFVGAIGVGVAAYVKRDPLRDVGAEQVDAAVSEPVAPDAVPLESPAPEAVAAPSEPVDADGFTPEDRALLASMNTDR